MKFASKLEAQHFCAEVGRFDLVEEVDATFEPDDELITEFVKRRKQLVRRLKDFRKSQDSKGAWKRGRSKFMKGIQRFHKSTAGKRFHRQLGRFIATRTNRPGHSDRREESLSIYEAGSYLKALASAETHAFIELEYYQPIEEELDYWGFLEVALAAIASVKTKLVEDRAGDIEEGELDLLVRMVEPKELFLSVIESRGSTSGRDEVEGYWEEALAAVSKAAGDEEDDCAYLHALQRLAKDGRIALPNAG